MVHRRHRPVVAIICPSMGYRVAMYIYDCLGQMLRPENTFDFGHELTTDMTHCRPEVCKFILAFQVAKVV